MGHPVSAGDLFEVVVFHAELNFNCGDTLVEVLTSVT